MLCYFYNSQIPEVPGCHARLRPQRGGARAELIVEIVVLVPPVCCLRFLSDWTQPLDVLSADREFMCYYLSKRCLGNPTLGTNLGQHILAMRTLCSNIKSSNNVSSNIVMIIIIIVILLLEHASICEKNTPPEKRTLGKMSRSIESGAGSST